MNRIKKRIVKIGDAFIGGDNKILVQSMLNINPYNIEGNIKQALSLKKAGCDIIRVAIPNKEAIPLIYSLKNEVPMPVVADIHFDYKLAIESVAAGADKIRINPGNIGGEANVKEVVTVCKEKNIPIRIGVNAGSLEKNILQKYQKASAEALCESALYHVSLLEKFDFENIVLSLKSSCVETTVKAYKLISNKCDYPLHLGVTEAGTKFTGVIKSSCAIGSLLLDGIGDTVRFSLTDDPVEEIIAAKKLLRVLGLSKTGAEVISCPTCGRTKINVIKLATQVEEALKDLDKNIKVAVMGCVVNGPGESREADIGITGGNGEGLIFKKGKILRKVKEDQLIKELMKEINNM